MIALVGSIWNVSGRSIAIVAAGPSPGMTPTIVPKRQPMKHHMRLPGVNATAKPWMRPSAISIQKPRKPIGSATLSASGKIR